MCYLDWTYIHEKNFIEATKTAGETLENKRKTIIWKHSFYQVISSLRRQSVRAGVVQPGEGKACTWQREQRQSGSSQCCPVRGQGNGRKMKYSKLHLNHRRGCGVSLLGSIQNPAGHCPRPSTLGGPACAGLGAAGLQSSLPASAGRRLPQPAESECLCQVK